MTRKRRTSRSHNIQNIQKVTSTRYLMRLEDSRNKEQLTRRVRYLVNMKLFLNFCAAVGVIYLLLFAEQNTRWQNLPDFIKQGIFTVIGIMSYISVRITISRYFKRDTQLSLNDTKKTLKLVLSQVIIYVINLSMVLGMILYLLGVVDIITYLFVENLPNYTETVFNTLSITISFVISSAFSGIIGNFIYDKLKEGFSRLGNHQENSD